MSVKCPFKTTKLRKLRPLKKEGDESDFDLYSRDGKFQITCFCTSFCQIYIFESKRFCFLFMRGA